MLCTAQGQCTTLKVSSSSCRHMSCCLVIRGLQMCSVRTTQPVADMILQDSSTGNSLIVWFPVLNLFTHCNKVRASLVQEATHLMACFFSLVCNVNKHAFFILLCISNVQYCEFFTFNILHINITHKLKCFRHITV